MKMDGKNDIATENALQLLLFLCVQERSIISKTSRVGDFLLTFWDLNKDWRML